MKYHSRVTATEKGLIIRNDGEVFRIHMTMDEMISLATALLNYGVVEMRNERTKEALMSGAGAGDVYVPEEEEKAD